MRLLIDECVPRKVKFLFADGGQECETVRDAGFSGKENGELLALAEGHFDVLVTIDKNIRYQQNMTGRNISVLIIRRLRTIWMTSDGMFQMFSSHCGPGGQPRCLKPHPRVR